MPVRFAAVMVALTLGTACAARPDFSPQVVPVSKVYAARQLDVRRPDQPIVRRRAPQGEHRATVAFARTELYFGTAKRDGAVTDEEFKKFLDDVMTPLFPEGLTVTKAYGQFKGADGATIKEDSFVVVLIYPVEGHKTTSRNIDFIRGEYMRQHQQDSVMRVDDTFLVWVSF
jgi:Protein of unknown function (DUF3574)